MKKVLKGLLGFILVVSIVLALNVPVTANMQKTILFNGVNGDAPTVDDTTGLGLDFSIPTPMPDPNDAKPEVVSGDFSYKVQDDGTAIITHYSGNGGDVTVPSTIDSYTVTKLGDASLQQCNINNIKLPDSLTILGAASLATNNLTTVTIPQNVKYVDFGAFTGNVQLKNVTVLSSDTIFGWGTFEFCPSNITVYAPKGSAAEAYAKNYNQGFKFIAKPATKPKSDPAAPASFTAKLVPMKHETSVTRDVKCTWAAVKGATGYEVYCAGYGPLELVGSTTKALNYTVPSLNTGMYHYFKVRAYKMVNGKKVYGNYSLTQYILVTDPYLDK